MRLILTTGLILFSCAGALAQDLKIVGGGGMSIEEIVSKEALVTVVFNEIEVKDPNLRILELHDEHFVVLAEDKTRASYFYDAIKEVIVQQTAVETTPFRLLDSRALSDEHQRILDLAIARTREIYDQAGAIQELRKEAATLLAVVEDPAALSYLNQLLESNDIITRLDAATALYLVGKDIPEQLIDLGLRSEDRNARLKAVILAGRANYRAAIPKLTQLAQQRSAEFSAPAALALARMEYREVIPNLLTMIASTNDLKGAAGVLGLTQLGGDDIIEQMKIMLKDAVEPQRHRYVMVLHGLNDPAARKYLLETFEGVPTLAIEAAVLLAKDGDEKATLYLRDRMRRREAPSLINNVLRARNAMALIEGGDPTAISYLQELLREEDTALRAAVCMLITELGARHHLTIIQPTIASQNPFDSLYACTAVVALTHGEYRRRLLDETNAE
jgi:HEAT repeat protein